MSTVRMVPAAEFKAKCLKLMDEVNKTKRPIVVTKRGVPVGKLMPAEMKARSTFGCMKGTATILSDIVSPIDIEWDAMKDE